MALRHRNVLPLEFQGVVISRTFFDVYDDFSEKEFRHRASSDSDICYSVNVAKHDERADDESTTCDSKSDSESEFEVIEEHLCEGEQSCDQYAKLGTTVLVSNLP